MPTDLLPSTFRAPRYMPVVLKGMAISPSSALTAMTPPHSAGSSFCTASSAACRTLAPHGSNERLLPYPQAVSSLPAFEGLIPDSPSFRKQCAGTYPDAGSTDGDRLTVGIVSAADDRRVADAAGGLASSAAGGGGCRDSGAFHPDHCPDSSRAALSLAGRLRRHSRFSALHGLSSVPCRRPLCHCRQVPLQRRQPARRIEEGIGHRRKSRLLGHRLGRGSSKHDVRRVEQHLLGSQHGVFHVGDHGDRSAAQVPAVHDRGL
eukprot:scaffold273_cov242-Pinguiococcus_pyrenoidosus.AAC.15